MEIAEFGKLEEKINFMVDQNRVLKEENSEMKLELEDIKKQVGFQEGERDDIKKKVSSLIDLIDSIEK